jgi:hypothetical protein
MNDLEKILLGAFLSIVGGFLAQFVAEFRKRRDEDRKVLATLNRQLTDVLKMVQGNVSRPVSQAALDHEIGKQLGEMSILSFELHLRKHRKICLGIFGLSKCPQIVAEDTVSTLLCEVQHFLNPNLLKAYEHDKFFKELRKMGVD